jgi:hypothetical protein
MRPVRTPERLFDCLAEPEKAAVLMELEVRDAPGELVDGVLADRLAFRHPWAWTRLPWVRARGMVRSITCLSLTRSCVQR